MAEKLKEFISSGPLPTDGGASAGTGGGGASGEMSKILQALEKAEPDVKFDGPGGEPILDRAALEMAFSAYSQSMQNPQLYNKWLGIDEKIAKALRQYKSDVRLLIAGLAQQGQAQSMIADQIPGEGGAQPPAAPAPTPAPQGAAQGKDLPTR